MYVDLVGVVVGKSVEVVFSLVVACEGTVSCDGDEREKMTPFLTMS